MLPASLGSCRILAFFFESMVKFAPRMLYDPSIWQHFVELIVVAMQSEQQVLQVSPWFDVMAFGAVQDGIKHCRSRTSLWTAEEQPVLGPPSPESVGEVLLGVGVRDR